MPVHAASSLNVPCCRNHIPWAVIAAGSAASAILLLIIRFVLVSENTRREREQQAEGNDAYDDVYVVDAKGDGTQVEKRVDKVSFFDVNGSAPT
jgi:ACS family allantoate permease-like MFS transporter